MQIKDWNLEGQAEQAGDDRSAFEKGLQAEGHYWVLHKMGIVQEVAGAPLAFLPLLPADTLMQLGVPESRMPINPKAKIIHITN